MCVCVSVSVSVSVCLCVDVWSRLYSQASLVEEQIRSVVHSTLMMTPQTSAMNDVHKDVRATTKL